jgi:hypothetical protein
MVFKREKRSNCSKLAYGGDLKKHMCLSKENHLSYKQENIASCLPVIIEFGFEQNAA